MPRFDQTGPSGEGLGTGRRLGPCYQDKQNYREFQRQDCFRRNRRMRFFGLMQPTTGQNWLITRKAVLEKELDYINQALQSTSKE